MHQCTPLSLWTFLVYPLATDSMHAWGDRCPGVGLPLRLRLKKGFTCCTGDRCLPQRSVRGTLQLPACIKDMSMRMMVWERHLQNEKEFWTNRCIPMEATCDSSSSLNVEGFVDKSVQSLFDELCEWAYGAMTVWLHVTKQCSSYN